MTGKIEREAISAMRRSYGEKGLDQIPGDPFDLFHAWLRDAAENPYIVEANAMVLSTVEGDQPFSRTVLLKDVTETFSFFTNYESRKSKQIALNNNVSLLFPWYAMERQVIVLGSARKVSKEASNQYFQSRPWAHQIGAWASKQSSELKSRDELEERFQVYAEQYPEGSHVPTPDHWGGFEVVPTSIEFWQGRYSRLHDRIRYERESTVWNAKRLNP
jgi:pyridoxamine 5'-phosphate oxidase